MSMHQELNVEGATASPLLTTAQFPSVRPLKARRARGLPVMSEAAAPDVPAAVGKMIALAYGAIIAAFLAAFGHSHEAAMIIVIAALYKAMYFAVPAIMLHVEGDEGRVSMDRFLRGGLETWTGHVTGPEAIVKMLLVAAILLAVTLIGVTAALVR